MSFSELLASLEAEQNNQELMAKSLQDNDDDEAIARAAKEGDDGDGECLTKSLVIDDQEFNVVDADALVKSIANLGGRVKETESTLFKGLQTALLMIKSQGELIQSLGAKVASLGSQGAGRRSTVSVLPKPEAGAGSLTKSFGGEGEAATIEGFMAKSLAAYTANKITGKEYTTIDVAHRGRQLGVLDKGLIARVLA